MFLFGWIRWRVVLAGQPVGADQWAPPGLPWCIGRMGAGVSGEGAARSDCMSFWLSPEVSKTAREKAAEDGEYIDEGPALKARSVASIVVRVLA